MAAAKSGESKTVLIVFLILFVLATIILGVTTYMGFDGQEQLKAEAAKWQKESKAWEKEADFQKGVAMITRNYIGEPLNSDLEALGTLRASFDAGSLVTGARDKGKEEAAKLIKDKLDKELGWDPAQKKAKTTYKLQIEQLLKALTDMTKTANDFKEKMEAAETERNTAQKDLKSARDDFDQKLKAVEKKANDDLVKHLDTITALQKDIEAMGKEKEKLLADNAAQQELFGKEKGKMVKMLQAKDVQLSKASDANIGEGNKKTIAEYDYKAKGRIISVDRTGRTVYVNLGRGDNIKTGFTFNVHGVDPNGKPKLDDKGSLEIVKILPEDHLSEARLTEIRDPKADPVLRGDLLLNAPWNPNRPHHVAIAGLIDLSDDGNPDDDLDELRRNLEKMGVIIDAYLNLKDLSIKGEITKNTDYLILGGEIRDDGKNKQQKEVFDDMMQKARHNAVPVIKLKQYLSLMGYRSPTRVNRGSN